MIEDHVIACLIAHSLSLTCVHLKPSELVVASYCCYYVNLKDNMDQNLIETQSFFTRLYASSYIFE